MWFIYAVAASVLWGVNYSVYEHVMRKLSAGSVFVGMIFGNIALATGLYLSSKRVRSDIETLTSDMGTLKLYLVMIAVGALATLCIVLSIREKNATMAAMIEITYPLFTALFAYLFFRETQFNTGTLAGALLILAGVCCIYFFGKNI